MSNESTQCLFCKLLGPSPDGRAWHDQVLYSNAEFSVLPGLGAQAEGYLLIVPTTHVHSSAELDPGALARLDETMKDVAHVLNQAYGPCIFFEHGACGTRNLAGGCIDHVHIHAIPIQGDVVAAVKPLMSFTAVTRIADVTAWAGKPYLAVQNQAGELFVATGRTLPGQFMRRIVGEALGRSDEWDYELFPEHSTMRATITRLEPLFASMQTAERLDRKAWQDTSASSPLVYLARAVDNRPSTSVIEAGEMWRIRVKEAGFRPVDPVVMPFPQLPTTLDENRDNFLRVAGDLAWLRRSDALLIDMSLDDWSYVGCVCELVYAHSWGIPSIVMAGTSAISERLWLRYHATHIVKTVDDALNALNMLFPREAS
jgi:ATP adenylyltransferase